MKSEPQQDDPEWNQGDVQWDGLMLTAQSQGGEANIPAIDKYYIKGRGAGSTGATERGTSASTHCRVPGCNADLTRDLAYFRKYRICREHLKSPVLVVEGVPSRFCQQCSRFHHVKEFDGPQRTCRAMLERLRLKRSSGKAVGGGGGGGGAASDGAGGAAGSGSGTSRGGRGARAKGDTRHPDAVQTHSSSRSNSTGNKQEEGAPSSTQQQQQQQLTHALSGEGLDTMAGAAGAPRSRTGHQQIALMQSPGSAPGVGVGGGGGSGPNALGASSHARPDTLQLFLSHNVALLPIRRDGAGAAGTSVEGPAAAAPAGGRAADAGRTASGGDGADRGSAGACGGGGGGTGPISEDHSGAQAPLAVDRRLGPDMDGPVGQGPAGLGGAGPSGRLGSSILTGTAGGGSSAHLPGLGSSSGSFFADAPYGHGGNGGGGGDGLRLQHQQLLAAREQELLLLREQEAVAAAAAAAAAVAMERAGSGGSTGLGLSAGRVAGDMNLEMQLRAMYREMAIGEMATPQLLAQQDGLGPIAHLSSGAGAGARTYSALPMQSSIIGGGGGGNLLAQQHRLQQQQLLLQLQQQKQLLQRPNSDDGMDTSGSGGALAQPLVSVGRTGSDAEASLAAAKELAELQQLRQLQMQHRQLLLQQQHQQQQQQFPGGGSSSGAANNNNLYRSAGTSNGHGGVAGDGMDADDYMGTGGVVNFLQLPIRQGSGTNAAALDLGRAAHNLQDLRVMSGSNLGLGGGSAASSEPAVGSGRLLQLLPQTAPGPGQLLLQQQQQHRSQPHPQLQLQLQLLQQQQRQGLNLRQASDAQQRMLQLHQQLDACPALGSGGGTIGAIGIFGHDGSRGGAAGAGAGGEAAAVVVPKIEPTYGGAVGLAGGGGGGTGSRGGAMLGPGTMGSAGNGSSSMASMMMATIPEAGDGRSGSSSGGWASADEVDAALDMLMEESGSGAVYQTSDAGTLERICVKLHHMHPRDLPPDLMSAVGSWLAGAPADLVQGAIRPGCTHLILDVYALGEGQMAIMAAAAAAGGRAVAAAAGSGASAGAASGAGAPAGASRRQLAPGLASLSAGEPSGRAAGSGGAGAAGDGCADAVAAGGLRGACTEAGRTQYAGTGTGKAAGRVLDALVAAAAAEGLSIDDLESAAAFAGAEEMKPHVDVPSGAAGGGRSGPARAAAELRQFVMHGGSTRGALATYKKLLGPRAVQSMCVAVGNERLALSARDSARYVADIRGTVAGLRTPLLLSVWPLAVVAGLPTRVRASGAHLLGPGRRPHVRMQGAHVHAEVSTAAGAAPGGSGVAGTAGAGGCSGGEGIGLRQRFAASPDLAAQVVSATLPGSHRAEAVDAFAEVELRLTAPPGMGMLAVEWEDERGATGPSPGPGAAAAAAAGGAHSAAIAISEWVPLLVLPDVGMAAEVNRLAQARERARKSVRSFLVDFGMVLDFAARVERGDLLPIPAAAAEEEEQQLLQQPQQPGGGAAAAEQQRRGLQRPQEGRLLSSIAAGGAAARTSLGNRGAMDASLRAAVAAMAPDGCDWQARSGGGGTDQRAPSSTSSPAATSGIPSAHSSGGDRAGATLAARGPFMDLDSDVVPVGGGHVAVDLDSSRAELQGRPRLYRRHLARIATLLPRLLAFAADAGLAQVMGWLIDFSLEYVYFGDLAAAFAAVEAMPTAAAALGGVRGVLLGAAAAGGGTAGATAGGGGGTGGGGGGLPLLHRAVRSGSPRAVRVLLARAASAGMMCNFAQPTGPFRISPLHLAALQPGNGALLQACSFAGPHVQQLWHTVTDAAGRTPAMYAKTQVEKALHAASVAAAAAAAGAGAAGSRPAAANRASVSGGSSANTYRSWGSDAAGEGLGSIQGGGAGAGGSSSSALDSSSGASAPQQLPGVLTVTLAAAGGSSRRASGQGMGAMEYHPEAAAPSSAASGGPSSSPVTSNLLFQGLFAPARPEAAGAGSVNVVGFVDAEEEGEAAREAQPEREGSAAEMLAGRMLPLPLRQQGGGGGGGRRLLHHPHATEVAVALQQQAAAAANAGASATSASASAGAGTLPAAAALFIVGSVGAAARAAAARQGDVVDVVASGSTFDSNSVEYVVPEPPSGLNPEGRDAAPAPPLPPAAAAAVAVAASRPAEACTGVASPPPDSAEDFEVRRRSRRAGTRLADAVAAIEAEAEQAQQRLSRLLGEAPPQPSSHVLPDVRSHQQLLQQLQQQHLQQAEGLAAFSAASAAGAAPPLTQAGAAGASAVAETTGVVSVGVVLDGMALGDSAEDWLAVHRRAERRKQRQQEAQQEAQQQAQQQAKESKDAGNGGNDDGSDGCCSEYGSAGEEEAEHVGLVGAGQGWASEPGLRRRGASASGSAGGDPVGGRVIAVGGLVQEAQVAGGAQQQHLQQQHLQQQVAGGGAAVAPAVVAVAAAVLLAVLVWLWRAMLHRGSVAAPA
ncbi:hypothetical protein HXX76_000818 [Chlamydomonas incerta]|uniref:SBP-type domain-containing protein n=1 Tax=Chlamydomonas incerta TaxID=51695 RepID=A0A836B310_CHLIN|nr:hypothetical protein HXX76_000818 [Chlamydomonas incerta]|eukprot:KAG2446226.1 hypothetical protein HXX76_000818 [Chlamydomonas incerta]